MEAIQRHCESPPNDKKPTHSVSIKMNSICLDLPSSHNEANPPLFSSRFPSLLSFITPANIRAAVSVVKLGSLGNFENEQKVRWCWGMRERKEKAGCIVIEDLTAITADYAVPMKSTGMPLSLNWASLTTERTTEYIERTGIFCLPWDAIYLPSVYESRHFVKILATWWFISSICQVTMAYIRVFFCGWWLRKRYG